MSHFNEDNTAQIPALKLLHQFKATNILRLPKHCNA